MMLRNPRPLVRRSVFACIAGVCACGAVVHLLAQNDALQKSAARAAESGGVTHFDGQRAFQYTREVVAIGPRPVGSEGHKRLEAYIHAKLKGDDVEDDRFNTSTPAGTFSVNNIIAKYPGTKDGIIVIGSHYDTNYPLPKSYVGANDGGSTTGLLLELANELRGRKRDGYSVWLVWFDAEEAFKEWSNNDSLYGSRQIAAKWRDDGTLRKIKALLLTDMIGDKDLNVDRDANSTSWVEDLVGNAAANLGYQSYFFARTITIDDDHVPFQLLGVPCADLIDFDYGYANVFHHTPQDTMDKLSPKSLQIVGDVVLESIHLLDAR